MFCETCTIKEQLTLFELEINELNNVPNLYIVGYGEELECELCEEVLEPYTMYFKNEDEITYCKELIAEKIGERLSKNIEYCSHCNGEEITQFEYSASREEIGFQTVGIDIWDFLSEKNVLETYHDLVVKKLICQHCKYGEEDFHPKSNPDGGYFDLVDSIYSQEELDEFWGIDEQQLNELASKYKIDLTNNEIECFIDFLYGKPLIAFKSETAKKFYNILKKVFIDEEFDKMKIGETCYRGRIRGKDDIKFKVENLNYPPFGVASHGRYNAIGVSVLYCTNDINGIPYEIEPNKNQCIDIAEFKCVKELKLFNIDSIFRGFSEYMSKENVESRSLKKNYLLTNFISDSCSDIGYDGIIYKSAGNLSHKNIAVFRDSVKFLEPDQEVKTREYLIQYKTNNLF